MPGEAARNADAAGGPFAAPVLRELHRLGCRGVHQLAVAAPAAPEWVEASTASPAGWRFGVAGTDGGANAVLLAFDDPGQLPPATRDALARCLDATRAIAPAGDAAGDWRLVDGQAMARTLHDLRNGLNSLLMNAAVVAAKLPPAERDSRFVRQVQLDGERCAALLQALADDGARRVDGAPAK